MSLARKNSILSKTINVDHSANGDTLFIPHSGIVNISGILTATSGNFSSQTVFASGTAAAPAISIVGDTDTGIGQLSANGTNSLSIMTSGVERVTINSVGNIGIGSSADSASKLLIAGTFTSTSNNCLPLAVGGTIPSGATNSVQLFRSAVSTEASSFTIATLNHFFAAGPSLGAGSAIANQIAFRANSTLTGATNNYGFYSDIASGTGRWNFYANGTADNYFAGNVGIGTSSPSVKLDVYGADAAISVGTSSYGRFQTSGGNAIGYMYGSFAALGDGIHLTYNHYHNAAGTLVISNSGGFTSRITAGYGAVMFATSSAANVAPTERMRITSDGSVGIGTSSPSFKLDVSGAGRIGNGVSQGSPSSTDIKATAHTLLSGTGGNYLAFGQYDSGSNYAQWIQSSFDNPSTATYNLVLQPLGGNVGIGTTTVSYRLHVVANASATNNITTYLNNTGGTRSRLAFQDTAVSYAPDMGSVGNSLTFDTVGVERVRIGNNGRTQFFAATEKFGIQLNNGSTGNGPFIGSDGADIFCISTAGGAERLRVDAAGNLLVATTNTNPAGNNVVGVAVSAGGYISITRDSDNPILINRKTNDGTITSYQQDGTTEGSVSVAGNTVSYNAFCGSHWAQLIDNSRPEILRGTVLDTIDEMCEWPNEPENHRLPRVKISDTPRSRRVYGVFMAWDNDDTQTGDMYVTALGAYMIRVSGLVQSGDLLESAGDGTARSQSDDIIRSSTIGKVSSTHRITEYDDGSYLVPCILMCG